MVELSMDYERAWALIKEEHLVPCWVDYSADIRDIAYASLVSGDSIRIGARGICYIYLLPEEILTINRFKSECECLNVEFYLPFNDSQKS